MRFIWSYPLLFHFTLILLLWEKPLFAQNGTLWEERFHNQAPEAWKNYHSRARRLQGYFTVEFFLGKGGQLTSKAWCEFKQRGKSALFIDQSVVEDGKVKKRGTLTASNSRYAFELRRRTEAGPWAVSIIGPSDENSSWSPRKDVEVWSTCPFTFSILNLPLGATAADPAFSILRATSTTKNGKELVQLEIAYKAPPDKPRVPSLKGWVLFDPNSYWVICGYEVQLEWQKGKVKGKVKADYEYRVSADNFPLLTKIERDFTVPISAPVFHQVYKFNIRENEVPEKEFTLTGYGFTEPVEAPQPPTRWYLWAGGGALACLALAILLRRLGRRNLSGGGVGQVPTGAGK